MDSFSEERKPDKKWPNWDLSLFKKFAVNMECATIVWNMKSSESLRY